MKQTVNDKLFLFTTNPQKIKSNFKWYDALTKCLAALITLDSEPMDCEAIKECYTLIKALG